MFNAFSYGCQKSFFTPFLYSSLETFAARFTNKQTKAQTLTNIPKDRFSESLEIIRQIFSEL